jgi:hypothetical protein
MAKKKSLGDHLKAKRRAEKRKPRACGCGDRTAPCEMTTFRVRRTVYQYDDGDAEIDQRLSLGPKCAKATLGLWKRRPREIDEIEGEGRKTCDLCCAKLAKYYACATCPTSFVTAMIDGEKRELALCLKCMRSTYGMWERRGHDLGD